MTLLRPFQGRVLKLFANPRCAARPGANGYDPFGIETNWLRRVVSLNLNVAEYDLRLLRSVAIERKFSSK
jgi:hypothetical protein